MLNFYSSPPTVDAIHWDLYGLKTVWPGPEPTPTRTVTAVQLAYL